jgi:hypothetical protein
MCNRLIQALGFLIVISLLHAAAEALLFESFAHSTWHSLRGDLRLLVEEAKGLTDLLVELGEVVEVGLDLFDVKIDEHTSDLGSSVGADELLDVVENEVTNHGLVVRVLRNDGGDEGETSLVVGVNNGVLVRKRSLRAALNTGSGDQNLRSGNLLLRNDGLSTWLNHGLLSGSTTLAVAELALATNSGLTVRSIVSHGSLSVVVGELRNAAIETLLEKHKDILDEVE